MKIIIYIIFFLSIINFNNLTYADGKIVYLNVNYVFSNSVPGKNANKSFDKKIKTLESDVNNFKKNINDEKDKLIKKKNILSEDIFNKEFANIENKIKEFNKNIAIRNKEIVNLRKKVRLNFAKELKKILNDYSTQNSIQMILKQEDILIGSKNLDISNDILKIIDSNNIKLIE
jgi:Skp family chaperone for outer membrane proteins|tara:strand:- start:194 stop:715 length:522 start_codon:yes stop_codon:yes gene_type:complete